ncbi:MAG: SDR family oxidoreductase [Litorimonas sp.]
MHVLILGGYGLIGTAICKQLLTDGYDVSGLGRSAKKGASLLPSVNWFQADISTLTNPNDWDVFLENIDIVVNASGALQNGLRDNLVAVQKDAITALIGACAKTPIQHFVQISAPGVDAASSSLFYRTKAAADMALKSSSVPWTIFRPGLVISPHAYGGTSLIRMLAAMPYIQPIVMGDSCVQTVSIEDVAKAVSTAISERMTEQDIDLVEVNSHTLLDVTLKFRQWLGFGAPKFIWKLPLILGSFTAGFADILGWLGWRSALRTTSLKVLKDGVQGKPETWKSLGQGDLKSLTKTLFDLPSTKQERLYARAMLAFPFLLAVLSGFWIISGVIGFWQQEWAVNTLRDVFGETRAKIFVRTGSVMDILIGCALLFRPSVRLACLGSILLSLGYLSASAWFTPQLWSDPLGPMVKVFPAMALAVIVASLMEDR